MIRLCQVPEQLGGCDRICPCCPLDGIQRNALVGSGDADESFCAKALKGITRFFSVECELVLTCLDLSEDELGLRQESGDSFSIGRGVSTSKPFGRNQEPRNFF